MRREMLISSLWDLMIGRIMGEQLKTASGDVQTGHQETFFYRQGGQTLGQVSQRGGLCPSLSVFKRCLDNALNMQFLSSGSWTRWSLQVPPNCTILYRKHFCPPAGNLKLGETPCFMINWHDGNAVIHTSAFLHCCTDL